ncbi:DUF6541 family protein [Anaerotardibacter muris]|uniref:DUF6541 family protein n=1 Tax=Anaerotardibacter muris TaxID=2941505 RepID=UPI00203B51E4|nr:DUF6541 family protein [Anaerotardibacter muris]
MVLEFILSCALITLVLYLPSTLLLRAAHLSCWKAIAFAPLLSILLYSILGVLYSKAGITATGWTIGLPVLLFALVVYGVGVLRSRKRATSASRFDDEPEGKLGLVPLLYVAVGFGLYAFFYLAAMPSMGHAAETYDNVFHYNLIRSFVDSGVWSSLNGSVYLDGASDYPSAFTLLGVYYPAAWHAISAFPVSLLRVSVPVAANATNFVFVVFVYALSMCLLLRALFASNRKALIIGAFVTFAFGAYPWVLLAHWPLYPNLISMTMTPLLCASFLFATKRDATKRWRVSFALIFLCGVLAEAFCQPSAVFVAVVLLAPYVVSEGSRAAAAALRKVRMKKRPSLAQRSTSLSRFLFGIAIIALIAVAWWVLFSLPFMQSTVNYYWTPILMPTQAMASCLSMSLALPLQQYVVALMVAIGCIYILAKKRNFTWLIFSYLFACCIFVVAASLGDCWLKHFLSGFWYTDPYRAAAIVGMAGVPLAALGLYALVKVIQHLFDLFKPALRKGQQTKRNKIIFVATVVVVCIAIYSPVAPGNLPFFKHVQNITATHAARQIAVAYPDSEKDFIEQAKAIVGEDDVVLNLPHDGSMMAYGMSDFPVYYRSISGYGKLGESQQSAILREGLSDISTNDQVKRAVEETSADYVLILTIDPEEMSFTSGYKPEQWVGIESIADDTPGFELVLASENMRLYKIQDLQSS